MSSFCLVVAGSLLALIKEGVEIIEARVSWAIYKMIGPIYVAC